MYAVVLVSKLPLPPLTTAVVFLWIQIAECYQNGMTLPDVKSFHTSYL
jgi:hypothetical protein